MKKLNALVVMFTLSLAVLFTACSGGAKTDSKETENAQEITEVEAPKTNLSSAAISAEDSRVNWKGELLGVYAHEGTVKFTEGNLSVADNVVTGGNFVVDMTSISPTDENFDVEKGNTKEKLIGHLSSNDFFAVEDHSAASFEITSVSGNTVTGNLTIRGKTNEETVENIEVSSEDGKVTVTGSLTFDRKKYDVSFNHPAQDMVISDNISLNIALIASS